jgi:hypothetical protein
VGGFGVLKAHMGVLTGGSGALGALFSECCTSGAISLRFALGHTLIFIVGKKSLPDFFFD